MQILQCHNSTQHLYCYQPSDSQQTRCRWREEQGGVGAGGVWGFPGSNISELFRALVATSPAPPLVLGALRRHFPSAP